MTGEMKKGALCVDGVAFLEYSMGKKAFGSHDAYPRNLSVIIEKFGDYDFTTEGHTFGGPANFTVKGDANLLAMMKAVTLISYRAKSLVSDYACFNCLMYKYPVKKKMDFTDTHTAKIKHGIANERRHNHTDGWLRFKYFQIYYGVNNIYTIFEIKDLAAHKEYFELLPEKYYNIFKDSAKCRECKQGECSRRFVGELFGVKSAWCNTSALRNFNEIYDLLAAIEIIKNIYLKKQKIIIGEILRR